MIIINHAWLSWYSHRRIIKGIGGFRNKRMSGDHSHYCIIENGLNAEKSPGNLKKTFSHSNFRERLSAKADLKTLKK